MRKHDRMNMTMAEVASFGDNLDKVPDETVQNHSLNGIYP